MNKLGMFTQQNFICPHAGQNATSQKNMIESHKLAAEWKNSDTKVAMHYDDLHLETEN